MATLPASIRSVLAQTHTDWELLITDDRSRDDSWSILREFAASDSRIQPESSSQKLGPAGARNAAIDRAKGQYIAFLDSDDLWLPEKLSRQVEFAQAHDAAVTFTSYYKIAADFDGEAAQFTPNRRIVAARSKLDYRTMLQQNYIGCLTGMYSVGVLGKRYMPALRKRQDYGLWLSLLRTGVEARGMTEPLALYREQRPGSLSGSSRISLVQYNWQLYREVEELSLARSTMALGQAAVRSTLKRRI